MYFYKHCSLLSSQSIVTSYVSQIWRCLRLVIFCRKPIKSTDFHSYVTNLERDSGLLFTVEYEVRLNHTILAGTARQPLFSVILSRWYPIYLCMYVCPQIFAAASGCSGRATSCRLPYSVSTHILRPDCGCTAHCAGVNKTFSHYNLSPAANIYRRHRHMRSSGASQKDYRLV